MHPTVQGETSKDILKGISITLLILAISFYMPILGFFCSLLVPLPVLFYRAKLGRTNGLIIPVATLVIMSAINRSISMDLLFFVELLFLGFVLSELIEMDLSIERTILYACGAILLTVFVALYFYSSISHMAMGTMISDYIKTNLEYTITLYREMGVSEENIQKISSSMDRIQYVLVRIIPAIVGASTLFLAWMTLLLAKPLLFKHKLFYPDFGPLNSWRAPEFLVWPVIACGLLILFFDSSIGMLGYNGIVVLMVIYFFSGIALVSFFFEKKRFPRILKISFYSFIAIQQVLLLLVIILGFFDIWFNFRKMGTRHSA
ncbi:MAG: YybS family protein [Desulfobacterales bacterium]|nr:YybS family protein [Desulfobacterales bacterium]